MHNLQDPALAVWDRQLLARIHTLPVDQQQAVMRTVELLVEANLRAHRAVSENVIPLRPTG